MPAPGLTARPSELKFAGPCHKIGPVWRKSRGFPSALHRADKKFSLTPFHERFCFRPTVLRLCLLLPPKRAQDFVVAAHFALPSRSPFQRARPDELPYVALSRDFRLRPTRLALRHGSTEPLRRQSLRPKHGLQPLRIAVLSQFDGLRSNGTATDDERHDDAGSVGHAGQPLRLPLMCEGEPSTLTILIPLTFVHSKEPTYSHPLRRIRRHVLFSPWAPQEPRNGRDCKNPQSLDFRL
jgi:hypothetical protein